MSTVLTKENIADTKAAVNTYMSNCEANFTEVKSTIDSLIGAGFIGDASIGYNEFFSKIAPAISTNLYGKDNSICTMLNSIMDGVEQMINPVDTTLGNNNKNAG